MNYPQRDGNRIDLLKCGAEYFPALLAAIEAAEREIFLEAYIYAEDETAMRVTAAFMPISRTSSVELSLVYLPSCSK